MKKENLILYVAAFHLTIALLAPLFGIVGVNFILESLGHPEIPYTASTWFGSWLFISSIRYGLVATSKSS